MKNRIILYVSSLIMICSMFILPVCAAGNVLVYNEPHLSFYDDFMNLYSEAAPVLSDPDENGYYIYNSQSFGLCYAMAYGNMYQYSEINNYLPEVYDYYLLFTAYAEVRTEDFTFAPDNVRITYQNCVPDSSHDVVYDVRYYHHDKRETPITGFTVTAKLEELSNVVPFYIYVYDSSLGSVPDAQMRVKVQIVQVDKAVSIEFNTDNLLDKLTSIDNKLGAVNDSLGTVNDSIQDTMIGYEGSVTQSAADTFTAGADELTQTEEQLTSKSSQYVDDFTVTGFDAGVLDSLGGSLVFVVTWFTNFWNMGGLFTAALTLCFAVSIAFFILKLKR